MDTRTILQQTSHRPWPLRGLPWVLQMSWENLAFLHWPLPPEALRPLIPSSLELDTFEGNAWIAVTPFVMNNVRLRFSPPIPTTSRFEELNVRTYVRRRNRSGVWFFSLDAASALAVGAARAICRLPYFDADMEAVSSGERVTYRSRRSHKEAPEAEFRARYWPTGPVVTHGKGSLEHWLTERYCLFSAGPGERLLQLDIHHVPWPLQAGAAEIETNSMTEAAGIVLPDQAPLVHYASRLDVLAWGPSRVREESEARGGRHLSPETD